MTTVNMYKNGTVMVQGNLTPFELDFLLIKERAQQGKSAPTDNNHTLPETDTTPTSGCPAADPEEKEPTGPEPAQDPQLDRAITDLKVKFTELERELVQLRELTSQQPAQDTRVQQDSSAISTELTKLRQDRESNRRELSTVRTEVRELQQDRESHMARPTALTEEVRELREERRSYRRKLTALSEELQERERVKEQLDSHPDHNQNPVTPIESSQNPPTQQPPSTPSSISSPHANPTPRSPPITQMNTTPSPQTNTTPHPSRPAQQRGKPDIVILIDSNGKFIDENKLFPTHTVAKIWCPNTQHAMDLLSEQQLGSPSHIIIHTGSNDLRSQQERVSESLKEDRESLHHLPQQQSGHVNPATKERPPPRHHPQDQQQHVRDFPIFARTLKDVALNRDQSTPRRRSSPAQNPLRPERSHQGSYDYPQARPEPLLSPGVPPQPQRRELHPDPLSYAQAVKRTAGPTLTTTTHVPEPTHTPPHDELRDIQQMLSLLCSHLIGQVPQ
ncbi:Dynactin subunit 1 [Dissostichus eleginoides]|uniref:Dynactin subunit 1 n=1 Tax=Dissostichus eleginoides TaxID=100907 RepID=A0AAD9CEU9_DISEL|nr:Dynactin subunit 1 [Dissostichus eleginoides]